MNDDHSTVDDEVLSAVLDGAATPDERARVQASPEALARLEQLSAASAAVSAPVPPLEAEVADALVARALDEADRATGPAEPVPLRRPEPRPAQERAWPARLGVAVGAAAAIVVLVVAVAGLAGQGRSSSSDSAQGSGGQVTADDAVSAESADASGVAGGSSAPDPPDLGALVDAGAVLDRYAERSSFSSQPEDAGVEATTAAPEPPFAENSRAEASGACPVPPLTTGPGEVWAVVATAQLPDGPVVVMAGPAGGPGTRLLVVDLATCTVLAETVR